MSGPMCSRYANELRVVSGFYRIARRMPRGRPEIFDFRDDETLRVSNHLTPRQFTGAEINETPRSSSEALIRNTI